MNVWFTILCSIGFLLFSSEFSDGQLRNTEYTSSVIELFPQTACYKFLFLDFFDFQH